MKCSACKFWKRSQLQGSYCTCMGRKPCDRDRRDKIKEHRKKHDRRNRKYDNNDNDFN